MDLQKLVIATISLAKDQDEEELLRLSLKELSLLGIPVFITDGGSSASFVNDLRRFSQFNVLTSAGNGLWAQAETSLQHAAHSGAPFIFYTEPDKTDFFMVLPGMLNAIQVDERTGVVLASRTVAGMASFPAFQQMTEATINNCCAEAMGQNIDYTYGPFLLNKNVIPHLQALPADIGWGWRPYAFNIASRMGLKITAVAGDYYCPTGQQEDNPEQRFYRMKQLIENIRGLVLSAGKKLL